MLTTMKNLDLTSRVGPFVAMLEYTFESTVPDRLNVTRALAEVASHHLGPFSEC